MKTDSTAILDNNSRIRYSVLLLDDEPDVVATLQSGLERIGPFDVQTFTNPEDALKSVSSTQYHILLVDVRMPTMSGFEFYEKALQLDASRPLVVFMTASEGYAEEYAKRYPKMNGDCFVMKPISIKSLASLLLREVS